MLGYLWAWFQFILIISCSLLYPLYRSSRIFKRKENPANMQVLLKYWVIYAILFFVDTYLRILIDSFITFYAFLELVLYIALVLDNFRLSTIIYDNGLYTFFSFNEPVIDNYLKIMNDHISDSREKAVKNGRTWVSNFFRNTLLPTIMSFLYQNPQEPVVDEGKPPRARRSGNTANPMD